MLAALSLIAVAGLAGCSKTEESTTSGGGATVSTTAKSTATTAAATGTTKAGAGANTVSVDVGDTNGLNGMMTMTTDPNPATAKAGKVTFVVKNSGTITHEMVVLQLEPGQTWNNLPVTADKVSEDTSKGETGDVAPGETKTIELNLDAGSYALVCNIEKHYAMGMRAPLTVTS